MRSTLKLSFHLPAPRRSSGLTLGDLLTIARTAEELGVDAVSVSDHPFPVVERGGAAHHTYDPFVLLSHVSAQTSRITLVFSLLVVPYRNPFLTASMLATLDAASNGRVVAGLGAGYARDEFDALGATFAHRGPQIETAAAAMRAAWTGEPVTMSLAGAEARGNVLRPVPARESGIPLWRGGNSTAAREQAARVFDGWMPFEVGAEHAGLASTAPATLATVQSDVTRYLEDAPAGSDVCFVRTNPRWTVDESRAAEEVATLAGIGVTWIESGSAGRSVSEVLDDLHRLVAVSGG